MVGVGSVGGKDEVESLWIGGSAAEAVAGSLVDGWITVHRDGSMAGCIGERHLGETVAHYR